MNLNLDPPQLSFEYLLEPVRQLCSENPRLHAEIEEFKRNNARSAAPFSKNTPEKNPKLPGRKSGQGIFRNRPAPPKERYTNPLKDVIRENACPDCGGELADAEMEVVTNTELPSAPQPEVKAYRIHIRGRRRCKRKVRGRHKVPRVPENLIGLQVTRGALIKPALRLGTGQGAVARQEQQPHCRTKEQLVLSTYDTGWRVNDEQALMMVFESRAQAVHQICRRHRNEKEGEVIGDDYQGTLCTGRGRSYDAKEFQDLDQQKCPAQIQRSTDKVPASKRGPARRLGIGLKKLLKDALSVPHTFHKAEGRMSDYAERARELDLRITDYFRPRVLSEANSHRLLNGISRHRNRGNLLRFPHSPQTIERTNNAAERALRPTVIARKVSPCSRNKRGTAIRVTFKSVIWALKKGGGQTPERLKKRVASAQPKQAFPANTS